MSRLRLTLTTRFLLFRGHNLHVTCYLVLDLCQRDPGVVGGPNQAAAGKVRLGVSGKDHFFDEDILETRVFAQRDMLNVCEKLRIRPLLVGKVK